LKDSGRISRTTSFRLDTGLLDLLKDYAVREGIKNTTEAVHRAIEAYLRG